MARRVRQKQDGSLHPLTEPLMVEMLAAHGSHRAQVIIAGVYVDALLQQMLEAAFIDHACVKDFFNAQAPLSSFHWKIEIAFAMGLIPGDLRRDLHRLRKLRNHFGHKLIGGSFSDAPAKQFLDETSIYQFVRGPWGRRGPMDPEHAFRGTMAVIAGFMEGLLRKVRRLRVMKDYDLLAHARRTEQTRTKNPRRRVRARAARRGAPRLSPRRDS